MKINKLYTVREPLRGNALRDIVVEVELFMRGLDGPVIDTLLEPESRILGYYTDLEEAEAFGMGLIEARVTYEDEIKTITKVSSDLHR
jgi:hypothetical protein